MIKYPTPETVPIHYAEGRKTTKPEIVKYLKTTTEYKEVAMRLAREKNRNKKFETTEADEFLDKLWGIDPELSGWGSFT